MSGAGPQVSVVLPVYNGAATVADSLTSILSQEGVELELIVIDDASTDHSRDVIRSFNDPRIVLVELRENRGLANALNEGVAASRAPLIARQDQDDVSHARRLLRQSQHFEASPDLVLLGTWAAIGAPDGRGGWRDVGAHRHPVGDDELRVRLLWNNPFVHSSVMFRRSAFDTAGGYRLDPREHYPEDYDLWSRLAKLGDVENLAEVLLTYRTTPQGMSRTGIDHLRIGVIHIAKRIMAEAASGDVDDAGVEGAVSALNNAVVSRQSARTIARSARTFWRASRSARGGGRLLLSLRVRAVVKIVIRSLTSARDE